MVSRRGPGARQGQLNHFIPTLLLRRPNGLPDPPPSWMNYIWYLRYTSRHARARAILRIQIGFLRLCGFFHCEVQRIFTCVQSKER